MIIRQPEIRIHADELVVDNFAGGGGTSEGLEWAIGRSPDIAINHDPEAIAMHLLNHPETKHYTADVFEVDPVEVVTGPDGRMRPIGLGWFSPDCTHFSKSKGGQPRSRKVRGLAWVVLRWARLPVGIRPRIIILENVEEFQDWGPLMKNERGELVPDPTKRGKTYRLWANQLRGQGYAVEARQLRACDFGAPTTRKRLFVIARCDGQPIVWPRPSHGNARVPYRTAAECIDWTLPCPSIFDRQRPLADKTMARIARGLKKYVFGAGRPFVVPLTHHGDVRVHSVDSPLTTITGASRGELALIAPTLIQTGWGEREGQAPRCLDLHKPLGTLMAGGGKHALVAAFLAKHYGGHENSGTPLFAPMDTITTQDHNALVTAHVMKAYGTSTGSAASQPLDTITSGGNKFWQVRAFLVKYYGSDGHGEGQTQQVDLPLHTVTSKPRFGLVTVEGEDYAIVDIGMRMLTPRELYRAQGFDDSYNIQPMIAGKPLSKTAQVRMCGNSVCPPLSEALAGVNFGRADNQLVA